MTANNGSDEDEAAGGDGLGNRIETRQLRYFVAIAEEMHFGRAAQRLNVAQPALSRQIARLEADIGGPLFDRTHAQIKLTAAGTAMLPRARDALRRLMELGDVARRAAAGGQGVIEIGFAGSATFSVLPEILKKYRTRYPQVDLLLYHMNNADLRRALVERRIQLAIARAQFDDPEIMNESIRREPLVVALPEDDPLAAKASVPLSALAKHFFILPNRAVDDQICTLCVQAGFTPLVAQETTDLQTAISLVAAGLGSALVPASVQTTQRLGVVFRNLTPPHPTTEFMLSYRRDNTAPLLQTFRAVAREYKPKKGR